MRSIKQALILYTSIIIGFICSSHPGFSQYFGKNKVQYEHFTFDVLESDHFAVHYYLNNQEHVKTIAELCELWYGRHLEVFSDTFRKKNPYILYNNHADFQQNTIIQSLISTGTHGVTEALRTRVVIPTLESNNSNSHIVGHELVHVFQYNMLKQDDSLFLGSIRNLPLWMVEGMSEYLTLGRQDMHTAIWMRDAVEEGDIPTLKAMSRNPHEYFPYRYGHAFWAFVTGLWGDDIIRPLFKNTAKFGYKRAVKLTLGVSPEDLSKAWARALKKRYKPYIAKKNTKVAGEKVFTRENAGRLNISPSISPNGKKLVFISDRDVISMDIYLANPQEGEIVKKLTSAVQRPYVDEYMYLGSSGTWSPDNKKYAMVTFSKGRNQLFIVDVSKEKITRRITIPEVKSFSNPTWSPSGNKIVITGLVQGQSDLYLYNLESEKLRQLTSDKYSDLHPEWAPNGKELVFISDRGQKTDFTANQYSAYRISFLDLQNDSITSLDLFPGADNINPHYSADGKSVYFLSNAEGFRNLYEYKRQTEQTFKLTNFYTGITGMTELSPAFTLAQESGEIIYSVYKHGNYQLYRAEPSDFLRTPVNPQKTDFSPSVLPPVEQPPNNYVDNNLGGYPEEDTTNYTQRPYRPKFTLEYLGSSGAGVGISQYGTAMSGGVNLLFSDMLKRNQVYAALQVNGEYKDIGGMATYVNRSRRFNWGAGFSHIPYRNDFYQPVSRDTAIIKTRRTFIDELNVFSFYPISKKLRLEGGVGYTHYGFDLEIDSIFYSPLGTKRKQNNDPPSENERAGFGIVNSYLALVGDDSHFGLASPLDGYRYRFQVKPYFQINNQLEWDSVNFLNVMADYRNYHFSNPFGYAFRFLHYGRYMVDKPDKSYIYPLYLGYNYFVRGYNIKSFQNCNNSNCLNINRLTGDKIMMASAEIRFPFSGPERLALISSKFFYSDLVFFMDGGIAWDRGDQLKLSWQMKDKWKEEEQQRDNEVLYRIPVFSTGLSLRVNLFGMLVLEPYYAYPFQRFTLNKGVWGISISSQGW